MGARLATARRAFDQRKLAAGVELLAFQTTSTATPGVTDQMWPKTLV